jgi:hypothetical protein
MGPADERAPGRQPNPSRAAKQNLPRFACFPKWACCLAI